jgi:hypothetical protein
MMELCRRRCSRSTVRASRVVAGRDRRAGGANIKSVDSGESNSSQTDLGINLLGGFERGLYNGNRFFVEAKVSVNDVPDLRVAIGFTFNP